AFNLVRPSQLFREGIALGCQSKVMFMLLRMYRLPRRLKGYGTFSEPLQGDSRILGSCFNEKKPGVVVGTQSTKRLVKGSKFR
ncbi:unnamed protein product, partial [Prorocentrum cordatum]